MSAGAPWSVKGIDPKAREVAKDLARRSGLTLGEWLNKVILEDDGPDEITTESQFAERPLRAAPAPQLRVAATTTPPELGRVAAALDRLTDRIEASETRTGLAINGVEHSVRQALARIETAEREQTVQTARLEGLLAESSAQQSYFGERLRRLEAEPANSDIGPRSPEALRALEAHQAEPELVVEAVLQRLGDRLAAAEARTAAALDGLQGSLAGLDRRMGAVEGGGGEPLDHRFETLARTLTERVESARAEIAEKLASSAAGGGFEARFAELTEQVRIAERRSAQAVEEIGRQVLSMAEAVGRKLTEVDERSAGAIDQVGTEVARIAGAVELRLARQEHAQAEAFERLQAELAKVTEALSERLETTEQRAAEVLDEVEAEVARVSGQVAAAPAASDFESGVASEVEAQVALAPASDLAPEPQPELVAPESPPAAVAAAVSLAEIIQSLGPPPEPEPEVPAAPLAEPAPAALGPEVFSRAESEPGSEAEAELAAEAETVTPPWRRLDLDVPEPKIPDTFAPLDDDDDEALFEPAVEPELSTREVIDRARAAARAAQGEPVEMRAKVEPKAATGRLFQGFGKPKKPPPNTALQTAMMIAGGAAFLSVGAAGLTLMQGPAAAPEPAVPEQAALPQTSRAALALGPGAYPSAPDAPVAQPVFAQVQADIAAGVPGAVAQLKALAEAGHTQAQLYLAELYQAGDAGLPQDPVEARRLTALAAEAGDAHAMHNLGLYLFRGEGGPQDAVGAAQWFRRAADAGVVESQFNLGRLYQAGSGVPKDLAAARHWFGRAAAKGDAEAKLALAELAPRAAPKTAPPRAPATAAAKPAPAPGAAAATAGLAGASLNVRQTQMVLARLGYYDGPLDGRASVAYDRALAEYRRAQAATGPTYAATR